VVNEELDKEGPVNAPAFDHPFEPNRQCSGLTCEICGGEVLAMRRALMPDYDERLKEWLS
jgi:hypothetical protein